MAGTERAGAELVSMADHLRHVLSSVPLGDTERVPLLEAGGRILRERVSCRHNIPPFDNSAMDGYAVRLDDVRGAEDGTGVRLPVIADLFAGTDELATVRTGTAARIMTGAPVPAGADAIVPIEDTDGGVDEVLIRRVPKAAAHIRRSGEDRMTGDLALAAGLRLNARSISSAASAGYGELEVAVRPRVSVISTGSELVAPGGDLGAGQIPESNSVMLSGLAAEAGAEVVRVTRVSDNDDELRETIDRCARDSDVIILSGGVSVGAYDVVKAVLRPLARMRFLKVAMQPGKPQGFGALDDGTIVFGLPGNPVSACVSFEAFVRPALLTMQGALVPLRRRYSGVATEGWRTPPGRAQFMPIVTEPRATGELGVKPASKGGSASHFVGSLAAAEGFAVVPAERSEVRAGETVDVILVEL